MRTLEVQPTLGHPRVCELLCARANLRGSAALCRRAYAEKTEKLKQGAWSGACSQQCEKGDDSMERIELTLANTTADEVLEKLPQGTVMTELQSGNLGSVHVVFTDIDEDEARRLATDAGFSVV